MRLMIMAFSISGAFVIGPLTSGAAQESYPWCTQGEILHCYYQTREQCELTVDYHGFCIANPEVSASSTNESAPRSHSVRRAAPGPVRART
jgi:hypothetical protein